MKMEERLELAREQCPDDPELRDPCLSGAFAVKKRRDISGLDQGRISDYEPLVKEDCREYEDQSKISACQEGVEYATVEDDSGLFGILTVEANTGP